MRYIKFRAWDKCNETMCEVFDLRLWKDNCWVTNKTREQDADPHGHVIHFTTEISEDEVGFGYLMQYTGLKDKNGKEIYEGDIVKVPDDYDTFGFMAGEIREIIFSNGGFRFKPLRENQRGHWLEDNGEFEVIGNIYENTELLKS